MANRDLTASVITELEAQSNRPAFFYEGVFDSTTLRLWAGDKDVTFQGETYLGNGWLQGIKANEESERVRSTGMEIELSGIPQTILSLILSDSKHSATGKLWLAMLDSSFDVIADEYLLFSGRLDSPEIRESGQGTTVSISYESRLVALNKRKEHRYTHEGQKVFYPDDLGFLEVPNAQAWSGYWGKEENPMNIQRRDRR